MDLEGSGGTTTEWFRRIPEEEWRLHREVVSEANAAGVPFALGGGLALWRYSGRWRNTKDMDLFCCPDDASELRRILGNAGFTDYYAVLPYDRGWIYRGHKDDVIVDVIWEMANHCCQVAPDWFERAHKMEADGLVLPVLAPEEILWTKLFVLQRDRCDWPDMLNILAQQAPSLDWPRLLELCGTAAPLLGGVMNVFRWLCPEAAGAVPGDVWGALGLAAAPDASPADGRAGLLDTREWFGPNEPALLAGKASASRC